MPVMSSQTFRVFSQDDLESIVAYLRSQPAAPSPQEPQQWLNPLALVMLPLGMLPVKPIPEPEFPAAVAIGPTVEYGAYVAGFVDCVICHGDTYEGGTSPIAPQGPSLRHVSDWTVDEFMATIRTGVTPDGRQLGIQMPWESYRRFEDTEIIALYEFLKTVG